MCIKEKETYLLNDTFKEGQGTCKEKRNDKNNKDKNNLRSNDDDDDNFY